MNIRRVRNGSRGVLVRTALGRVQTGKSLACCWKDGKTVSRRKQRDFPGGPVVKTSPSNIGGAGSIPGWEAKIPHALQPKSQGGSRETPKAGVC